MSEENQQPDCPQLFTQLDQLKELRTQFAAEADIFRKNPHYEKQNYREMMDRLEKIENKFEQICKNIPELYLNFPLEIKKTFLRDYQENIKIMSDFYHLIQEDPEKPGRYFYLGDYDGRAEAGGKGHDFSKEKFVMPTLAEIFSMLTPDQIKLYNKMQQAGERPKLQLVPLALKLRTMAAKLDDKKDDINKAAGTQLFKNKTYIWDIKEDGKIDEIKLIYEPTLFTASPDGKKLKIIGGMSKSAYIKKNKGWAVEIIATKPVLEKTKSGTNSQKTEAFMKEALAKGFRGCTFESALLAQMVALSKPSPEPLDDLRRQNKTIISDSSLTDDEIITTAEWTGIRVGLSGYLSRDADNYFRFRRLVRLKNLEF